MEHVISDVVKEYPHMYKIIIWHNNLRLEVGSTTTHSNKIDVDPSNSPVDAYLHENRDIFHDNAQRSLRRTKTNVEDIILCNRFDYWCTFTFDKRKIDRFDVDRCRSSIRTWFRNQKIHSPNIKYVIVPEFHKRCQECTDKHVKICTHSDRPKAIHFHALISNYNGKLKLAKYKNNKTIFDKHSKTPVYNISSYRSGFSTAVKVVGDTETLPQTNVQYPTDPTLKGSANPKGHRSLERRSLRESINSNDFNRDIKLLHKSAQKGTDETYYKLAKYITKYITKEMPLMSGGNRYFCSNNLERPKKIQNGIRALNLSRFLKHREPVYIDDIMEIQYVKKDEVAIAACLGNDPLPSSDLPGVIPSVIYNQG